MEIMSTQHILPISTQHHYEKYDSDISIFDAYRDFIFIEVKLQCWPLWVIKTTEKSTLGC